MTSGFAGPGWSFNAAYPDDRAHYYEAFPGASKCGRADFLAGERPILVHESDLQLADQCRSCVRELDPVRIARSERAL